jgi:hypothetical protein
MTTKTQNRIVHKLARRHAAQWLDRAHRDIRNAHSASSQGKLFFAYNAGQAVAYARESISDGYGTEADSDQIDRIIKMLIRSM